MIRRSLAANAGQPFRGPLLPGRRSAPDRGEPAAREPGGRRGTRDSAGSARRVPRASGSRSEGPTRRGRGRIRAETHIDLRFGHDPDRLGRLWVVAGSAVGAAAIWLLIGGWVGVGAAAVGAVVLGRRLRRVESRWQRRSRAQLRIDTPFAADLLATVLRSGAPIEHGMRTVGMTLGGDLGRKLVRVADSFRLGLDPADAWRALRTPPESARIAYAVERSPDSGAAVAGSLERLADTMRTESVARAESRAQRLAVLLVLPLGLCFLPAFILAGVVPVIVAVLGDVLR